jgi:ketosteroid isomerase-like protein
MWAPEYSFVTANGAIVSKAQRLDFIRASNTQFESLTSDEESVRLYGDTAVVVACTSARGQGQGRDLSGEYRGTTVLVKKQEKWLMVLQQTNLISAR